MANPILSDRTDWSRSFFNLQLSAGHLPRLLINSNYYHRHLRIGLMITKTCS